MYKIGQLLYIIANASKTIEPVLVVSRQTHEDAQGTNTTHICKTIDGKTLTLEKKAAEKLIAGIFENVEDAESHLKAMAAEMVRSLADDARKKASLLTGEKEKTESIIHQDEEVKSGAKLEVVELPDGTTARVHLPTGF